jgi:hypothetical protein
MIFQRLSPSLIKVKGYNYESLLESDEAMAYLVKMLKKKFGDIDETQLTSKHKEELRNIYNKLMRMDADKLDKEGGKIVKQLEDLQRNFDKK